MDDGRFGEVSVDCYFVVRGSVDVRLYSGIGLIVKSVGGDWSWVGGLEDVEIMGN